MHPPKQTSRETTTQDCVCLANNLIMSCSDIIHSCNDVMQSVNACLPVVMQDDPTMYLRSEVVIPRSNSISIQVRGQGPYACVTEPGDRLHHNWLQHSVVHMHCSLCSRACCVVTHITGLSAALRGVTAMLS